MATSDSCGILNKGSVGIYTYYERDGQIIARVRKNMTRHHPPTRARATQMTKFANLITAWRSMRKVLKNCFENKKPGATDYSAFMAVNLKTTQVHLPKELSEERACLADNFVVSQGNLIPCIQVWESEEYMVSDILVNNRINSKMESVGDLTTALIISNEPRFEEHDELLFIRITQVVDINNHVPRVQPILLRFTLENDYVTPLQVQFAKMNSDDGFLIVDGHLAARKKKNSLVAWIHRRKVHGRWTVTSQQLIGTNDMLNQYLDQQAIKDAVSSYNPAPTPFLIPYQEPVPLATVDVVSGDLQLGTTEGSGSYPICKEVVLRAVPKEGCRFLCWDDGCEEAERTLKVERPLTLKAIFAR